MQTTQTPIIGMTSVVLAPPQEEPAPVSTTPVDTRTLTWKTADDAFVDQCYEDMMMQIVKPHYQDFEPAWKVFEVVKTIPNPRSDEISTTHPDNVDLVMEIPGHDPQLAWEHFVRGCATVSLLITREWYPDFKTVLQYVAEQVFTGKSGLPAIDGQFWMNVSRGERAIFLNEEHTTWRSMISFMQGAYWTLSYIDKPKKRRGSFSPLEFVDGITMHFAAAGRIPL